MPDENIGTSAWCDMRSPDTSLYLHDLQLLHEEMVDTPQNDALRAAKSTRPCAFRKNKRGRRRRVRGVHAYNHTYIHIHIISYRKIHS